MEWAPQEECERKVYSRPRLGGTAHIPAYRNLSTMDCLFEFPTTLGDIMAPAVAIDVVKCGNTEKSKAELESIYRNLAQP